MLRLRTMINNRCRSNSHVIRRVTSCTECDSTILFCQTLINRSCVWLLAYQSIQLISWMRLISLTPKTWVQYSSRTISNFHLRRDRDGAAASNPPLATRKTCRDSDTQKVNRIADERQVLSDSAQMMKSMKRWWKPLKKWKWKWLWWNENENEWLNDERKENEKWKTKTTIKNQEWTNRKSRAMPQ